MSKLSPWLSTNIILMRAASCVLVVSPRWCSRWHDVIEYLCVWSGQHDNVRRRAYERLMVVQLSPLGLVVRHYLTSNTFQHLTFWDRTGKCHHVMSSSKAYGGLQRMYSLMSRTCRYGTCRVLVANQSDQLFIPLSHQIHPHYCGKIS